MGSVFKDLSS
jgi:protein O-GlcNAc transferase